MNRDQSSLASPAPFGPHLSSSSAQTTPVLVVCIPTVRRQLQAGARQPPLAAFPTNLARLAAAPRAPVRQRACAGAGSSSSASTSTPPTTGAEPASASSRGPQGEGKRARRPGTTSQASLTWTTSGKAGWVSYGSSTSSRSSAWSTSHCLEPARSCRRRRGPRRRTSAFAKRAVQVRYAAGTNSRCSSELTLRCVRTRRAVRGAARRPAVPLHPQEPSAVRRP